MVLIDLDTKAWAQDIFGSSQLGDQRLNNRLQKIASQLSASIGSSLASSYNDNEASLEGRYRFVRKIGLHQKKLLKADILHLLESASTGILYWLSKIQQQCLLRTK